MVLSGRKCYKSHSMFFCVTVRWTYQHTKSPKLDKFRKYVNWGFVRVLSGVEVPRIWGSYNQYLGISQPLEVA